MDVSYPSENTVIGLDDQCASLSTIIGLSDQSNLSSYLSETPQYDEVDLNVQDTHTLGDFLDNQCMSTPKKRHEQRIISPPLSPIENSSIKRGNYECELGDTTQHDTQHMTRNVSQSSIESQTSLLRDCLEENRDSSKKRRRSKLRNTTDLAEAVCCKNKCITTILTIANISDCEIELLNLKETEQKNFILAEIAKYSTLKWSTKGSIPVFNFVIRGQSICAEAWCLAYNVSRWKFNECKKLFSKGCTSARHGNVGRRKLTEKTTLALSWMRSYFRMVGDYMPHKSEVHLPRIYTKKMLYQRMIKELGCERQNSCISYEHFTRIWLEYLSEFSISKVGQIRILLESSHAADPVLLLLYLHRCLTLYTGICLAIKLCMSNDPSHI